VKPQVERIMIHPLRKSGLARTYLIDGRDGILAVDVGSIGTARDVESFVVKVLGRNIRDVKYITATHFHIDHIAGIGHLLERCAPDAKVLFHSRVRDYLDRTRKLSLLSHWWTGCIPAVWASVRGYVGKPSHFAIETIAGLPISLVREWTHLPYGEDSIRYFGGQGFMRYRLGFDDLDVIETPGHTEDSVSFYRESTGELISGDLILNFEKDGCARLNRFHWSRNELLHSYQYLRDAIEPKILYPGHGKVINHPENVLRNVKVF
jgi:glyoxylase-like metal-dependent hydrolase (beta-lactamase superfamily II)